tara:strand:+ start:4148 stop:4747 length:600 start_codon:yes stop_codon:yes gene_type:complete
MTKADKKKEEKTELKNEETSLKDENIKKEVNIEEKLKISEDKLLRTLAEMENQRRRFEKERQEAFEFGGFSFAKESLSLLDNMDRATDSFKNDENLIKNKNLDKVIESIEIIKKDLISIFKKNNIEPIECIDKKFDPNFHQAMMEVDTDDKESGTVVQEIQKGYMMKDRLLRPSLVGVAKKTNKNNEKVSKVDEKKDKK